MEVGPGPTWPTQAHPLICMASLHPPPPPPHRPPLTPLPPRPPIRTASLHPPSLPRPPFPPLPPLPPPPSCLLPLPCSIFQSCVYNYCVFYFLVTLPAVFSLILIPLYFISSVLPVLLIVQPLITLNAYLPFFTFLFFRCPPRPVSRSYLVPLLVYNLIFFPALLPFVLLNVLPVPSTLPIVRDLLPLIFVDLLLPIPALIKLLPPPSTPPPTPPPSLVLPPDSPPPPPPTPPRRLRTSRRPAAVWRYRSRMRMCDVMELQPMRPMRPEADGGTDAPATASGGPLPALL